jgi:hypothetical protein
MGVRGLGIKGINEAFEMFREDATYTIISAFRKEAKLIYESKNMKPEDKRKALDSAHTAMLNIARAYYGKKPLE